MTDKRFLELSGKIDNLTISLSLIQAQIQMNTRIMKAILKNIDEGNIELKQYKEMFIELAKINQDKALDKINAIMNEINKG